MFSYESDWPSQPSPAVATEILPEDFRSKGCARGHYHRWRTHLSLAMDVPDSGPVQPPEQGAVVEFQDVGGLHRHYERIAA